MRGNEQLFHERTLDMRWLIANEARSIIRWIMCQKFKSSHLLPVLIVASTAEMLMFSARDPLNENYKVGSESQPFLTR